MSEIIKGIEFSDANELTCDVCGKNLHEDPDSANVVMIENKDNTHLDEVYIVCKGKCDDRVKPSFRSEKTDGWFDLNELYNPYIFYRKLMAIIYRMQNSPGYFSDKAYEKLMSIISVTYQYIARKATEEEKHRDEVLQQFPF